MEFKRSPLFRGIPPEGISACLQCSDSKTTTYQKGEILFHTGDTPQYLFLLLEGCIAICRDSSGGERTMINVFQQSGQLFGEVFLFLQDQPYPCYGVAEQPSKVMEIPKMFFYKPCGKTCDYHTRLIQNTLSLLASKAYFLNQKVRLLSFPTLRQKIIAYLLQQEQANQMITLPMNREQLAGYLGVTRPSLSRELMKMQKESLIKIEGRTVAILQPEQLQQFL